MATRGATKAGAQAHRGVAKGFTAGGYQARQAAGREQRIELQDDHFHTSPKGQRKYQSIASLRKA
jgi:hypothetical protein